MDRKKEVRTLALNRRAALSENERRLKSRQIQSLVAALPEYKQARTVMLFLNFRDEAETTGLAAQTLAEGKGLVLPRCAPGGLLIPAFIHDLDQDVEPGTWGIREPKKDCLREANPESVDFVLVPGAAFDRQGNRLGYGGGYYDRFFARLRPMAARVAIGFAVQVLPEVPVDEHDQKIDILVTEEGVERFHKTR
ncbi:5-Formyltetrahydrofolate cyclo-ligase [Acididesulfobacillus acetoxydans]|uniref:5-formyltetrahydrofolate cyclo-ligase n=1 Tax=Acididesulfobacillus acetoxydans TaxID=1561005 RepID=A0A8S0X4D3_9FIRM|nr:5-formyltetrahydrofolate cyclo-ligase [Acididesulfobacillus acetoxydans]CAA7600720.1 5-Formyltetrahydrofolate cyclo-ligase [Acididesulfobacillus acetoxydans]CEJ06171.1 5-formyltetrahydrofolate cyclo-ligase [Acididesulfobacillus acetoxydans]